MSKKMKKMSTLLLALAMASALVACGGSKLEIKTEETVEEVVSDVVEETEEIEEIEEVVSDVVEETEEVMDETPSGINEDGMGEDPDFGEGIGEVVAISEEEKEYMMSQTTNTWLELSAMEKDDLVVLIGRYLEDTRGYIVPDYDELIAMLDHQMEQYYRNDVNESVFDTVCDILGVE